ncbi:MAG: hypothetical protein UIM53_03195 [Acutalibacteraceae bacterium]|nr:hypothetical protein [Acutalibacteraceae bacterium]
MEKILKNLRQIASMVMNPDKYASFLDLAARFPNLNIYNLLLLWYQKPDATLVAGENAWKDNYSLKVKEGERAICLLRPTLIDEETLSYAQIGVFDISQLENQPEIKKEEFSLMDFFVEETGCVVSIDNDGILDDDDGDYKIIGDDYEKEMFIRNYPNNSPEENEKHINRQILTEYVDEYCRENDNNANAKALFNKSLKHLLFKRYDCGNVELNNFCISSNRASGRDNLQFLASIINEARETIEKIEHRNYVEFNFVELAFINMLIDAEYEEDYEEILNLGIENDDFFMSEARGKFIDKIQILSSDDFSRIFSDRKHNKMMTQPPYRCKLIPEF